MTNSKIKLTIGSIATAFLLVLAVCAICLTSDYNKLNASAQSNTEIEVANVKNISAITTLSEVEVTPFADNSAYATLEIEITNEIPYLTIRINTSGQLSFNIANLFCIRPDGESILKSYTTGFSNNALKVNATEAFDLSMSGEYSFYLVAGYTDWLNDGRPVGYTSATVNYFKPIILPLPEDPTKEGYTFNGWYLDSACTQAYDGRPITENLTLYAGWTINIYTVIFDTNGGNTISNISTEYNKTISLPTPTRTGYAFKGWLLNGESFNGSMPITDNTTLVATWEAVTLTVTFIVDGAEYKTMQIPYGTSLADVQQAAQMLLYDIKSVSFESGVQSADFSDLAVTDNAIVTLDEKSASQQAVAVVQNYWLLGLGGIGLIALIVCFIPNKKKNKSY